MSTNSLSQKRKQAVVSQLSDESINTYELILSEDENISLEKVLLLAKEMNATIKADDVRGRWLIVFPLGKNKHSVIVTPQHKGNATMEVVNRFNEIITLKNTSK